MPDPLPDQPPGAVPLDRETLIARCDGIRQGGRRAPNKPLLLLYALPRLKHDRQTEIRFNAAGRPPCSPCYASTDPRAPARGSPTPTAGWSTMACGSCRTPPTCSTPEATFERVFARQRDTPAGFAPDVLATFDREPELIDVAAVHLLQRHFAPGLHEEILEAVGLELGTPVATRRRDARFRAAVLEAYHAECCVCGFSLRLVEGLIGVDAAHLQWHSHGGQDEVPNGLALCTTACWITAPSWWVTTCGCGWRGRWRAARGLIEELEGQVIR